MKYNVLIVHNHYKNYGGEDSVFENEINLLKEHGHNVIKYERDNNEIDKFNIFKKVLLPFTTIYSFKTVKDIKKIIKNNKIDIIHVHNTLPLISPSIYYVAKKYNIKVVQTVHNFRFICPNGLLYRDNHICEECVNNGLKCAIKHNCYRNSKLQTIINVITMKIHRKTGIYKDINFICLTKFNKEMLLKQEQIDKNKVYIKPNYINVSNIKRVPFKDRKNQFTYVGRLVESKGIKDLLYAWKSIKSTLLVYGDGPEKKWCQNFIKENNLSNVKLMGFQDKSIFLKEISYSKALIVPSRWYEGAFPLSALEGYSCYTPLIARNIGNMKNGIIDKVSGLKYNNKEELIEIVNNIDSYTSLYDTDYKELIKDNLKENNYNKLIEIYNNVLNKKGE